MIDDIVNDALGRLFGEAIGRRLPASRRAQLLVRIFFGLLGAGLAVAGLARFAVDPRLAANGPLRLSMLAMFASLGSFFLCNVALGRRWRWPAVIFVVSYVSLFVTRIAFGN